MLQTADVFEYAADIPAEILPSIKAVLDAEAWLVPAWCQRVNVKWDSTNAASYANVHTMYDCRRAIVTFCPSWLDLTPLRRRGVVLHELIHISLEALHSEGKFIATEFIADEKFRHIVTEQILEYLETTVTDLENILLQKT